jgi:hypothetical protein
MIQETTTKPSFAAALLSPTPTLPAALSMALFDYSISTPAHTSLLFGPITVTYSAHSRNLFPES